MEAKFLASIFSFLSIFLAIYAEDPVTLDTHVNEKNSQNLQPFTIRSPLILSCTINKPENVDITWQKDGVNVESIKSLESRHKVLKAEGKFIIDKTDESDAGSYSCMAGGARQDFTAIARVIVRVPSNSGVVEGEKLSIPCTSAGTNPQLSWKIGNQTINNSTERFSLKADDKNVQNAILVIENASLEDRGEYTCVGRNDASLVGDKDVEDTSYVRVKGKLAALWPFLGICAEVLILCAIILIYEKRRNKTELEESDTDPQEQ